MHRVSIKGQVNRKRKAERERDKMLRALSLPEHLLAPMKGKGKRERERAGGKTGRREESSGTVEK